VPQNDADGLAADRTKHLHLGLVVLAPFLQFYNDAFSNRLLRPGR
jgi:hypothetical protein